jgi:uncharacterized metal-binding protein YceD (DUF177 family)
VVRPVEIDSQFYKIGQEVIVQGSLRAAVHLTCSRCAEEFEQFLSVALDAYTCRCRRSHPSEQKSLTKG